MSVRAHPQFTVEELLHPLEQRQLGIQLDKLIVAIAFAVNHGVVVFVLFCAPVVVVTAATVAVAVAVLAVTGTAHLHPKGLRSVLPSVTARRRHRR